MKQHSPTFKIGSVIWALLLGSLVIVVGGGILLPSTKRAHFEFQRDHQEVESPQTSSAPGDAPAAAANTQTAPPSSAPALP